MWFTIEVSDAIGRLKDGRIEKLGKGSENLEPLGLATGADGSAWYTDSRMRAISQVSSDGTITSFDLSTPVARLGPPRRRPRWGRLVRRADHRERDPIEGRRVHAARRRPAHRSGRGWGRAVRGRRGCAGAVWATLPQANKLVRISPDGEMAKFELPTRQSGPGDVAVDPAARSGCWSRRRTRSRASPTGASRSSPCPRRTRGSPRSPWRRTARRGSPRCAHTSWDGCAAASIKEFALPAADARPVGVAVDRANNVWYTDLSGWIGMLRADRARD